MDAFGFEPFAVGVRPAGSRQGGADIAQVCAALDEEARNEQLRAFIARQRDPSTDWLGRQGGSNGAAEHVARSVDLCGRHIGGVANGFQPGICAIETDWR